MKTGIDTVRLKQTVDLIELAGRHVELRKVSPKEHHGPCPWCGGDDRFRVTADHFACRQCGRKGDAIEFVMQRQNVDFIEAVKILGGDVPMSVSEKVKPVSKLAESAYEWDEPKHKQAVIESHVKLVTAGTRYAWLCMDYLQGRCIESETIKAFGIGYTAFQLPNTWDGKRFVYDKQLAISLPWFNHDGALVAVKYRFIEPHTYTDKDGKEQKGKDGNGVRFTSRGQIDGNVFGWQALRGAAQCNVLIICEGEMNALSLWQAGRGAVDVLSTGSEATTKRLPPVVVELAKGYQHKIVWADKKEIADAAALQIGAASMGSPKGQDANDLLKAGKLGALLTAMLGRLGISLPAEPSHTDVLRSKGDGLGALMTEQKAQPFRPVDTLLIDDAQPFDFNFESEPAPMADDTDPVDVLNLPPIRNTTGKPLLPPDLWAEGLATFAEAWAIEGTLYEKYATALGKDGAGFYVRCPRWQWVDANLSAMPV